MQRDIKITCAEDVELSLAFIAGVSRTEAVPSMENQLVSLDVSVDTWMQVQ
jgi:hypothetical protein